MIALLIAVWVVLGTGQTVSAHTDFDSSAPTDGAVVDAPLGEVVVNFTNPAVPAGDEFELLDPSGSIRVPTSVDETDGTSFVLTFDPPLEAGTYGLRWSVQAGDAHPIDGSFRFEVRASEDAAATAGAAPTDTAAPASDMTGHDMDMSTGTAMDMDAADHAAMSDEMLDQFLAGDGAGAGSVPLGRVGRSMSMLGVIFGVGVLAALVWTVRGHRDELFAQLGWVRLAGIVVFTGGLLEFAALAENDPGSSLGSLLTTKPGLATALKMAGGVAILVGFHQRSGRIVAPTHSLSAAVAADLVPSDDVAPDHRARPDGHRWTPTAAAAVGLLGYGLVLCSFWFDGHTVSRGPWAVHSIVNLVHLGAAAVWGGGVFAMTTVAWMRRRRSERLGLAAMVVRFSSMATMSLGAVILAGLLMTWLVLESPGDLFGTPWGRVLLVKVSLVTVAACLGAYNHFRLRPALEQRPDDPQLAKELRTSLTVESAVMVAIVILTAVLVASAT